MTGRHAAAENIDDEAFAATPQEPGAHRADTAPQPSGSAAPPAKQTGRRATRKETS